ncbi:MAG: GAF domain-containing sensor histidine kinase [Desulfatiglandaceae bacterium]
MLRDLESLAQEIQQEPWAKHLPVDTDFWKLLVQWIEDYMFSEFFVKLIGQVDEIVEISPDLSEQAIFETVARHLVDFLGAHSASVRIYDPQSRQMLSYGSFPSEEENRETFISLENSIAGEVVKTRKTVLVSDLLNDNRYHNKDAIERKGVHSLMAIPLEIPRFYPRERDTVGVMQIYYQEAGRGFRPLEVQSAETLAKRLSFVVARKKILSMYKSSERKEAIVRHIFSELGARGGIKVMDIFNRIVPELADMVHLQSCALFTVSKDLNQIILDTGYPAQEGYHSIGKTFPMSKEPVFEILLNLRDYTGDGVYEVVTPFYILVVEPRKSRLISEDFRRFCTLHNINSILYIPLGADGEISHVMTFDALDQKQRYTDDEIDTFLFLGRELMKAQKIERLDDALHDFKNPAMATAGFARRLKGLIEKDDLTQSRDQIRRYADILVQETSRLQELAMSLYNVGEAQDADLTDVLRRRFEINREAIKEQLKQNVELKEGPFESDLKVRCYRVHLERVFDNLLNNATKAIPLKGGKLSIATYGEGEWACAEITNTGQISEADRIKILEGEGEGRGLYITYRIIRLLKGKIEITAREETTTFKVCFPRH